MYNVRHSIATVYTHRVSILSERKIEPTRGGGLLPPSSGPTQVGTTAGLSFRVLLRSGAVSYQVVDMPRHATTASFSEDPDTRPTWALALPYPTDRTTRANTPGVSR